ncbi:MAG TPA: ATP-binding protein [Gallionella sp.]|nr:ATP-binding protein [Gallionella sp.]
MDKLERFLDHAERLMDKFERTLPKSAIGNTPNWDAAHAFRWERGSLVSVPHPHRIGLADLLGIERQKQLTTQNTLQFVQGRPANNVLLTGARGTGKSSLVKALLNEYAKDGLRLIEVGKPALADLPHIIALVGGRPERFILYCDDLSFNADEPGYQALKAALDGSLVAFSDNLLIYATSNRRHLMPESMQDNLATKYVGDEIHPGESIEEKISLSERFGLWVSFYPFSQDEYLDIVSHWLRHYGMSGEMDETARQAALQWAIQRGSRSGRVGWQFARDWAGRQ